MKYVILAGGSGTRLWPLSTKKRPKQFLNLINEKSMLQNTALRVSKNNGKDIFVVAGKESENLILKQLKDILTDFSMKNIISEPAGRNTAPAIAYSSLFFNPDDIIVILSSDHHISDEKAFNNILNDAKNIASENYIVTLGIIPDSPKTGYGYIKRSESKIQKAFKVECYIEKPDEITAKKYLNSGNYYWNAGIFIFKISAFLEELKKHSPEIYNTLNTIRNKISDKKEITIDDYNNFTKISIDYALMEKTDKLVVIPSDMGWSDIGSFKSLYEIVNKDKDLNVIKLPENNFINIGSKNIMVFGSKRKIAVIDVENISIIDTDEGLLITSNNSSEKVKEITEIIEENKK